MSGNTTTRHEFCLCDVPSGDARVNILHHLIEFTGVDWDIRVNLSANSTVFFTTDPHRLSKQRYALWHAFWSGLRIGYYTHP